MADKPKITFSTNPNPRNRALIDGLVPIEGYELEYVGDKYTPGEMHYRFVQGEFDLAEMSTATLMRIKEKGQRFRALPVFFQRGPRTLEPLEPLPVDGDTWEARAGALVEVLAADGLAVRRLTRAPYLSGGDRAQPFYELDAVVIVATPAGARRSAPR